MERTYNFDKKIGILGGGQLGKMLCLEGARLDLNISILDKDSSFPAAKLCNNFVAGDFTKYQDVLEFGKTVDVITIEIEKVNTEALKALQKMGKIVHPNPDTLDIIKDKGLQKDFYLQHNLPSSPFQKYENAQAISTAFQEGILNLPFVQKARTDGYDGRGVHIVKTEEDLQHLLDVKSIVEPLVDIEKEIAVIVAKNERGEISAFPLVEMEFHPTANLVEYLMCPSALDNQTIEQAIQLAVDTIKAFDLCGLLAVEMFLDKAGNILINEVAPRPHNSGHHTFDSCRTSQFEQHLRAVLNLPLGSTDIISPAVMVNLLGEDGYTGPVLYEQLDQVINISGVKLMLYGKTSTRPFRKMGHATVLAKDVPTAKENAKKVKQLLNIKSKT